MRRRARLAAIGLASALAAGCAFEPPAGQTTLNGDVYPLVQPVVAHSCASLDCHGREARPLRIYAVDGLRRSDDLRGEDLTQEELHLNFDAFEAIDPEPTRLHIVLSKPLSVDAGGLFHEGGDLWPDASHAEYRCIEAWLTEAPAAAACAEAAPDPP